MKMSSPTEDVSNEFLNVKCRTLCTIGIGFYERGAINRKEVLALAKLARKAPHSKMLTMWRERQARFRIALTLGRTPWTWVDDFVHDRHTLDVFPNFARPSCIHDTRDVVLNDYRIWCSPKHQPYDWWVEGWNKFNAEARRPNKHR